MINTKHIVGMAVAGICVIIIGLIVLWVEQQDEPHQQEQEVSVQQQQQEEKQPHKNATFLSLLVTPTTSTVTKQRENRHVPPNICSKGQPHEIDWSVTVEACTNNTGSPQRVIKQWQYKKQENMPLKYMLHKNGLFNINGTGFYKIYTKVTFERGKGCMYSVDMSPKVNELHIHKRETQIDKDAQVVEFEICGNITEKLSFFISLPKPSLVYLYPQKTYFIVEKMK